jgi:hypothetical protein
MILRWISGPLVAQHNAVFMSAYFPEVNSDSDPVYRVNLMHQVMNPVFHRQTLICKTYYHVS